MITNCTTGVPNLRKVFPRRKLLVIQNDIPIQDSGQTQINIQDPQIALLEMQVTSIVAG